MDHYLSSINIDLNGSLATTATSDTSCSFQLEHAITTPPHTHLLVGLKSFSLMNGFYLVNTGINDSFVIECESVTGGVVSQTITLTAGNYNVSSLITAMNSAITAIFGLLNLDSLSLNVDQTRNQIYFSLSYSTYDLIYISFQTSAYRLFGLSSDATFTYTGVTTGYFNRVYNLTGNSQLFVRLPNFQMDNRNMRNVSGIIGAVPIVVGNMQYIFYEPYEMVFFKMNSNHLNVIDVDILDQDMNPLGDLLVAGEFRLTLTIHYSWDKDILHPNILNKNNRFLTDIRRLKNNAAIEESSAISEKDSEEGREESETGS